MSSKAVLLVFLCLAISSLLVVSEVKSRDLAETSTSDTKTVNGLNDAKHDEDYGPGGGYGAGGIDFGPNGVRFGFGGNGFGPGGGGFGPGGRGFGPGRGGFGPGGGGFGPGRGGFGPGRGGFGPGRGGFGGGRGRNYCRFGCCRFGDYGCRRCCNYPREVAETVQPQTKPHN